MFGLRRFKFGMELFGCGFELFGLGTRVLVERLCFRFARAIALCYFGLLFCVLLLVAALVHNINFINSEYIIIFQILPIIQLFTAPFILIHSFYILIQHPFSILILIKFPICIHIHINFYNFNIFTILPFS